MKLYKIPLQKLQPPTIFQVRGGTPKLSYRYYPSWSTHTLVLFHGLVSSSIYLSSLAHRIAERKIAQVIIPDWRGHGEDIRDLKWDKPDAVIQDFEEVIIHFKSRTAVQRLSFLGHSFGARWLIKILLGSNLKIDNTYLISAYLKSAQLHQGWIQASPELYKINWPESIRTGKERFEYPREFLDRFDLSDRELELALKRSPFYLIEAGQDEILKPLEGIDFQTRITIPEATHMGIVMEPQNIDLICDLIEQNTILI
jgi:pimeloyl-ACP methyl ester carboxylesterase